MYMMYRIISIIQSDEAIKITLYFILLNFSKNFIIFFKNLNILIILHVQLMSEAIWNIIIIIIKICSMHIHTCTYMYMYIIHPAGCSRHRNKEKTWIQTIYSDSKNKIMYRDTCTIQLQIYIICEKLWHKMSFKQRLKSSYILWQDLSLVGRWFQSLEAETEKDLSPQVRFEVGSFRSDMLLEHKLPDGV